MKQSLIISCPASSRSGYGDHSRDLIRSLMGMNKFDIKILDQRWGMCPRTELPDDMKNLLLPPSNTLPYQPDVWIQVTVPNEFQPVGKYNIGITAGIETDRVHESWLEGCNKMDLIIVPSTHSKIAFETTAYDRKDGNNNVVDKLELKKPIHVLFEGLDTSIFDKMPQEDLPATIINTLDEIPESFCFLTIGHWMAGDFGHDRKDIGSTVLAFIQTFKHKKDKPALILKTSSATFSIIDREQVLQKIQQIRKSSGAHPKDVPNIYLLHGELTPEEINGLYNHPKVKAMVSFTHGEGFGRPLLEFSATGKPILATNWSGHTDFLGTYTFKIPGTLKEVHSSVEDKMIIKGSKWFYGDHGYASQLMAKTFKSYKNQLSISRKQRKYVKDNFSMEQMNEEFTRIITENVAAPVALKLPKLKLPKLEKVNA